jgi:hypothetical protein
LLGRQAFPLSNFRVYRGLERLPIRLEQAART